MPIEPYYSECGITIFCGDAREILPTLGRFDLLLTDPPYGLNIGKTGAVGSNTTTKAKHGMREWGAQDWDAETPDIATISQMTSQCDRSIIWGGNYFHVPPSNCWLIWDKAQRSFSFADGEIAWTNLDRAVRIKTISRGELTSQGRHHPTCKPIPLMQWCIKQAGPDAKTILDPFAGSCTTGVAAKLEGRQATLIEINERYCEIGANRLRQGVLDFGE